MTRCFNNNFDEIYNNAIEQLVSRTHDYRKARVNRKNGASSLDKHFQFIHVRWLSGKSLTQIMAALENEHSQKISKSALSRFVSKKFNGLDK